MTVTQPQGSCWPNSQQQLLLQAALWSNQQGIQAWQQWKTCIDIDQLDPGSYRLLPLLYQSLTALGIHDPLIIKLKSVYKHTWSQNQLLFHHASQLLKIFQAAGIETILLKGAALILRYYHDYGARQMGDFDVLVPFAKAELATKLLVQNQWLAKFSLSSDEVIHKLFPKVHGHGFNNAKNYEFDLHWHVLSACPKIRADQDFIHAAEPIQLDNLTTKTLCPADQLLHVCVHGAEWQPSVSPFRWLADVAIIINTNLATLDWHRLVTMARKYHLLLPVKESLIYVREQLKIPIPSNVIAQLHRVRLSQKERRQYQYKTRRIISLSPLYVIAVLWSEYKRSLDFKHGWLGYTKFLTFVKKSLGLKHLWQLPFYSLYRILRWYKGNRKIDSGHQPHA